MFFDLNFLASGDVRLSRSMFRSSMRFYAHNASVPESRLARQPGRERDRAESDLSIGSRCDDRFEFAETRREKTNFESHERVAG